MGFLTHDQKARIIRLRSNGKGASEIVRILAEDDIKISRWSIIRFLRRYQERQSLENAPKSGRPSQGVTIELMNFIDTEMERNDELTSPELTRRILLHFGLQFSKEKVARLHGAYFWFYVYVGVCNTSQKSASRIENWQQKLLWNHNQLMDKNNLNCKIETER